MDIIYIYLVQFCWKNYQHASLACAAVCQRQWCGY